jgi:hypothetical protein
MSAEERSKFFKIEKIEGVIHMTLAEGETTAQTATEMLEELLDRFGEGGYPVLFDIRGKSKISSEARAVLKDSPAMDMFPAVAYITHSFVTKLVLNSVVRFLKPQFQSASFSTIEDGLKWLDTYKK